MANQQDINLPLTQDKFSECDYTYKYKLHVDIKVTNFNFAKYCHINDFTLHLSKYFQ